MKDTNLTKQTEKGQELDQFHTDYSKYGDLRQWTIQIQSSSRDEMVLCFF